MPLWEASGLPWIGNPPELRLSASCLGLPGVSCSAMGKQTSPQAIDECSWGVRCDIIWVFNGNKAPNCHLKHHVGSLEMYEVSFYRFTVSSKSQAWHHPREFSKKFKRISLLHPQDTRALDVVEVSLSSFRNKGHTVWTLLGSMERLRFVFTHFTCTILPAGLSETWGSHWGRGPDKSIWRGPCALSLRERNYLVIHRGSKDPTPIHKILAYQGLSIP